VLIISPFPKRIAQRILTFSFEPILPAFPVEAALPPTLRGKMPLLQPLPSPGTIPRSSRGLDQWTHSIGVRVQRRHFRNIPLVAASRGKKFSKSDHVFSQDKKMHHFLLFYSPFPTQNKTQTGNSPLQVLSCIHTK
jgi:hypothetical protein